MLGTSLVFVGITLILNGLVGFLKVDKKFLTVANIMFILQGIFTTGTLGFLILFNFVQLY